jgi:hypothetical protein
MDVARIKIITWQKQPCMALILFGEEGWGGSKRCERINFVGITSEFQLSGNLKYP